MRAPANETEVNVDGTAHWVCYQEAKTEVKTEAKTEVKTETYAPKHSRTTPGTSKKSKKRKEKTEENTEVKITRTSRQVKNATAKQDFGQEQVGKKC